MYGREPSPAWAVAVRAVPAAARTVALAAVLAVMLVAAAIPAPTAAATDDGTSVIEEAPNTPLYLALGDSVAFGIGASDPDRTDYVAQLYQRLRDQLECNPNAASGCRPLHVVDLSESGATTDDVLADQLPLALDLITARNTDDDPLNNVEAITLTIGGNDVFQPVLAACADDPSDALCRTTVTKALLTVKGNLHVILEGLAEAAGDGTTIAVMTYYNPLPACERAPLAPLADVVLEGGPLTGELVLPNGLNDVIRSVAWDVDADTAADVVVADVYTDPDAATGSELTLDDFVGGDDCLHPDDSGYDVLTDVFGAVIPA